MQEYTDIPTVAVFSPTIRNTVELRSSDVSSLKQATTSDDEMMDENCETEDPIVVPVADKHYAVLADTAQGYFLVKCLKVSQNTFSGRYLSPVTFEDPVNAIFKETRNRDIFEFETVLGEIVSAATSIVNKSSCLSVTKVELNDIIATIAEIDDK